MQRLLMVYCQARLMQVLLGINKPNCHCEEQQREVRGGDVAISSLCIVRDCHAIARNDKFFNFRCLCPHRQL